MAYSLLTINYGVSFANAEALLLDSVTGKPAVILGGTTGGVVNDQGRAKLSAAGVLSVYVDTDRTWNVTLTDKTPKASMLVTAEYDPDTPDALPALKSNGKEILSASSMNDLQSLVGGSGPSVADLGSSEISVLRSLAVKNGALQATSPMVAHFPMNEGAGTTVGEAFNPGITGTVQGTTTSIWTPAPGINFNGSNNQVVFTLNSGLLRQITNLASMVPGKDQITISMILTHPTTLVSGAIMWFGLSSDAGNQGGWGVHLSGNWAQIRMRSPGSSAVKNTVLQAQARTGSLLGNGTPNTRTALAFDIQRSVKAPGYLEVSCYKASIVNRGTQSQNDWTFCTVQELHDGATALPSFNGNAALTLGGQPQADQANFTGRIGAGYALANLSLTRRSSPYHGLAGRVVQELAANSAAGAHYTLPSSLLEF